jgi:hypothetical protein
LVTGGIMTPGGEDLERRVARLEAWMDARLVTKDVFEVWAKNVLDRLEKGEEADTWLLRFVALSLVGVVVNAVFVAVSAIGR